MALIVKNLCTVPSHCSGVLPLPWLPLVRGPWWECGWNISCRKNSVMDAFNMIEFDFSSVTAFHHKTLQIVCATQNDLLEPQLHPCSKWEWTDIESPYLEIQELQEMLKSDVDLWPIILACPEACQGNQVCRRAQWPRCFGQGGHCKRHMRWTHHNVLLTSADMICDAVPGSGAYGSSERDRHTHTDSNISNAVPPVLGIAMLLAKG